MTSTNGNRSEQSRKRSLQKRDGGNAKRRNTGGNEPLLKVLIPDYAAGALIGKGGTVLKELKSKCGGKVRVSAGEEFYPGTQERVVVLTGEINQVIDLNKYIMENVLGGTKVMPQDGNRAELAKIILTDEAAGLLIGRGGETIKSIHKKSKAKLSISMPAQASVPGERVLTMSGSLDARAEGCKQVVEMIAKDATNMANTNLTYMVGNIGNVGFDSMGGGSGYNSGMAQYQRGNDASGLSYQNNNVSNAAFNSIGTGYDGSVSQYSRGNDTGGFSYNNVSNTGFESMRGGYDSGMSQYQRGNDTGDLSYRKSNVGDTGFDSVGAAYDGGMANYQRGNETSGLLYRNNNVSNTGLDSMRGVYDNGMAQYQRENDTGGQSYRKSSRNTLKAKVEVTIEVPDVLVGPIMGKQGSIIKDFVQRSGGARFKFSDKSESANRTLTISGNMDQTHTAYDLVNERVEQLGSEPLHPRGF